MNDTIVQSWEKAHEEYTKPIRDYIHLLVDEHCPTAVVTVKANYVCLDITNIYIYIDIMKGNKVVSRIDMYYTEETPLKKDSIKYTLNLSYYSHKVTRNDKLEIQKCIVVAELSKYLQQIEELIQQRDKTKFIESSIQLQKLYQEQRHKELEEERRKREEERHRAISKIVTGAVFTPLSEYKEGFVVTKITKNYVYGRNFSGFEKKCKKSDLIEQLIKNQYKVKVK